MSWATSGSSDVARKARPRLVRKKTSSMPKMISTEAANISSGSTPRLKPGASWMLAVSMLPAASRRLSAVKATSRPFCRITEMPKVTSSGDKRSLPMVGLSRTRCMA